MRVEITDDRTNLTIRVEQAEPECGQDFCDKCGDCLACYGYGPCRDGHEDTGHRWVKYVNETEETDQEDAE